MGRLSSVWHRLRARVLPSKDAAEAFWSEAVETGGVRTWLTEPDIRRYVNELITGDCNRWPMDWFIPRYGGQGFQRGLSIGCGDGALERDVLSKGVCRNMLAVDLSQVALRRARQLASQASLTGITYQRADFNRFTLPRSAFEIVFFHQSMHHVAGLEHCLAQVNRALTPGGLLYADEYIGPSRTEWTEDRLATASRVLSNLPPEVCRGNRIPPPIEDRDPSEAIRSSEIVAQIEKQFEIVEKRDYGGNILALVYPQVRWEELSDGQRREILNTLIDADRRQLGAGSGSYYTLIVAQKAH